MSTIRPFIKPVLETQPVDTPFWRLDVSRLVNQLAARANNINEITLNNGATSTTFTDPRITYWSAITFMPQTARAAGLALGMYVAQATQKNGEAVITHANPGGTDATFRVTING